nr:Gag-Pol polyprotein [Tanacetum cinerariifolium]
MLIHNSILNGPYVRRMIAEPGDAERDVNVNETFHEQTNGELSERELKQIEADDQAIHAILLGLPEDIYAAVDSCETVQEIWLRVQQMMKGSNIGIQEKKAKLNKHFPEKIASNLKFLNNLQPEWSRHVTIVHQTKDLHTADYTQLYDFLKYNQKKLVPKTTLLCLTRRTMFHGRLVFFGDPNRKVPVHETFHVQTDNKLTEKELKQIEADDQAIQTILLSLPEDIYAAV